MRGETTVVRIAKMSEARSKRRPISVRGACRGLPSCTTHAGQNISVLRIGPTRTHSSATPNTPPWIARVARRPRTADGGPSGTLRNVPPPPDRWPRASGGPERTGKGAETTQPASRMIRPAVTLTRDLVRRRHPTGASPSRRSAPGRTLRPMPSEQKGAYGGHLAPSVVRHGENRVPRGRLLRPQVSPKNGEALRSLHRTTDGSPYVQPYPGSSGSGSDSRAA